MKCVAAAAVFEGHQIAEEAWKKNGSKQERLAERKGQVSSMLPLACLMSKGYMQMHAFLFEHHGPLFEHYLIVLREEREDIETGAETQTDAGSSVI